MKKLRMIEDILKCKWTTLIINHLGNGVRRPGHLQRSIHGLSKKVMYERLKKLEKFEIVTRRQMSAKPLKVFYRLTSAGQRIQRIVQEIQALDCSRVGRKLKLGYHKRNRKRVE